MRFEQVRRLVPGPGRRMYTAYWFASCSRCAWRTPQLPTESAARRASLDHVRPKETHS